MNIARCNLALAEIGAGNYAEARVLLEDVREQFSEIGLGERFPLVYCGLLVCAASEGDWETFEHFHSCIEAMIREQSRDDNDVRWLAQKAAGLAAAHGRGREEEMMLALIAPRPSPAT